MFSKDMAAAGQAKTETLQPWDWRYYSEKLRKEKYDLDDDVVRPYFSLDNVREGAFATAGKLYGITFRENNTLPPTTKRPTPTKSSTVTRSSAYSTWTSTPVPANAAVLG